MMELDRQPHIGIPGITDIPPGWKRESREWLLAVAAITVRVWFFSAVGFFAAAIGLLWLDP